MSNPYWEKICGIAEAQRAKGIATYGQGIEENPADMPARITHLQEELVDALMYCEWIKDRELSARDAIKAVQDASCKIPAAQFERMREEFALMTMQDNLGELVHLSAEYLNATCRGSSCMECRYDKFRGNCDKAARAEFLMQNGVVIAVRCRDCGFYDSDGEFCKLWNGVRHPEHFCGEGVTADAVQD